VHEDGNSGILNGAKDMAEKMCQGAGAAHCRRRKAHTGEGIGAKGGVLGVDGGK